MVVVLALMAILFGSKIFFFNYLPKGEAEHCSAQE